MKLTTVAAFLLLTTTSAMAEVYECEMNQNRWDVMPITVDTLAGTATAFEPTDGSTLTWSEIPLRHASPERLRVYETSQPRSTLVFDEEARALRLSLADPEFLGFLAADYDCLNEQEVLARKIEREKKHGRKVRLVPPRRKQ